MPPNNHSSPNISRAASPTEPQASHNEFLEPVRENRQVSTVSTTSEPPKLCSETSANMISKTSLREIKGKKHLLRGSGDDGGSGRPRPLVSSDKEIHSVISSSTKRIRTVSPVRKSAAPLETPLGAPFSSPIGRNESKDMAVVVDIA